MTHAELVLRLNKAEREKAELLDQLTDAVEELAEKTSENEALRSRLYSTNLSRESENQKLRLALQASQERESRALQFMQGGLIAIGNVPTDLADLLALSEKSALLLEAFDLIEDPIFFAEPCGRIAYANPATENFFGSFEGVDLYTLLVNEMENPYRSSSEDSVVSPFPVRHGANLIAQLDPNDPRRAVIRRHVKVSVPSKGQVDVLLTLRMLRGEGGRPLIMVKVVDLEGVHKDPLTALWLRDTSDKALNRRISSRERDMMSGRKSTPLSVMIVDIDHFKKVNDTYGHLAGDEVIRRVAGRLNRQFRRDTDLVARWGGEELLVISDMEPEELFLCAETFRESIADRPVTVDLGDDERLAIRVTVSIGVAEWTTGMDREALTKSADECLYRAKEDGRNRTVLKREDSPPVALVPHAF